MQMNRCHECGREIHETARFCAHCGTAVQVIPLTEKLKVVTVLFCDIVDSTVLTARLGNLVSTDLNPRYYQIIHNAVTMHGGACGKLTGDGVMAVFGVPTLNDDDALRAVRAALQIQQDVAALSSEYSRRHGMPVQTRIGINTGQALVRNLGPVEDQVAGLTLNIARRLETACKPDEILIGDATYKLIQDWVRADPVHPPLPLKGIPEPVPAWRLSELDEANIMTRPDGPLIGRSRDLVLLLHLLDRVANDGASHLVTLIGQAGIGKSRLVREFERQVQDATVLKSACLPYGESITFWPINEMVRQAAGVRPSDSPATALERLGKLVAREPDGKRITRRVGQLLGWSSENVVVSDTELHDLHRALSRLFQVLAREQPLALIFDDLQWAEQGLLDSIKELASTGGSAPIMLVCMARPELLDEKPDWTNALPNSTTLLLPPLNKRDGDRLVEHFLEGRQMAERDQLLNYVHKHAEGNPLFMDSYLALLRERQVLQKDDQGRWQLTVPLEQLGQEVPPRLQLVIAARLERLEPSHRTLLERAAVVGGAFHAANIIALSPDEDVDDVLGGLEKLAQKALIIPDPTAGVQLPVRHSRIGYRFRHMLYRDVAYESLLENDLADLHERYASWLEQHLAEDTQADELIAHHLFQAYSQRVKRQPDDPTTRRLALRAAEQLLTAGQRANQRGELSSALASLNQAVELLPVDHEQRHQAMLDLADVLRESDATRAAGMYQDVVDLAGGVGDERTAAHAQIGALDLVGFYTDPDKPLEEGEDAARQAISVFERHDDHQGLAKAWRLRAYVRYAGGKTTSALDAIALAIEHARTAEDERLEAKMRSLGSIILFWGPTTLDKVVPDLEDTLSWSRSRGSRGLEATVLGLLARAAAMRGDFVEARRLNVKAGEIRASIGELLTAAADSMSNGLVELLAGELGEAERILRQGYADLQQMGGKEPLVNVAVLLARTLLRQGTLGEAEDLTREVERAVPVSQLDARIKWRSIRAVVMARQGRGEEAERLIADAIMRAEETEQPDSKAEAHLDFAEIMQLLGKHDAAAKAADRAHQLYLTKGNLSGARRVKALIQRPADRAIRERAPTPAGA